MKIFKIALPVLLVFYFVVYLFVPFFVTTADFGPDMSSRVSLSGFVWGGNGVRHIARYVQENLRWSMPLQGLSRDVFIAGVVWPVIGFILLVLTLVTSATKNRNAVAVLVCLWGLIGGVFFISDPVLNIGGLAYWLLSVGMLVTGAVSAAYVFLQARSIRKRERGKS